MSDQKYRVLYAGEVLEGQQRDVVQEKLAATFKLNLKQAENLFSGKAIVVKKGIDAETAKKYRRVFQKAGAHCRILKEKKESDQGVAGAATGEMITCRKCGQRQPVSNECRSCGVVFKKLEQIEKKKQKTLAPVASVKTAAGIEEELITGPEDKYAEELAQEASELVISGKGDEAIALLESRLEKKPANWRAYNVVAEQLASTGDDFSIQKGRNLLRDFIQRLEASRPEFYKTLALMDEIQNDEKGFKSNAQKAIALYQKLYPYIQDENEQHSIRISVSELLEKADLKSEWTVLSPRGDVVLSTTDKNEVFQARKSGKVARGSRVVENRLGKGIPLEKWNKPGLFRPNSIETPIVSRAYVITVLFGIAGLIYFFPDSWSFFSGYMGEVGKEWLSIFGVAAIPIIYLTIKNWRLMLILILLIALVVFGFGFFIGAVAGFFPSLLLSALLQPVLGNRKKKAAEPVVET